MNFLNAALLWGAAALAVPIIIHLFHKSRFQVVRWGAMHLLENVVRTNQRRIRLEQWLLLALRAALPVVLALLMARPVWTGARTLVGETKTSTVLLLDNSYSMGASQAGVSAFSRAREEAARLLAALPRGSEVQVLPIGAGGAPLLGAPTYDMRRAQEVLAQMTADYGPATVPYGLGFASGLLEGMHEPARALVVFTDFQRVSFGAGEEAALAQALQRLRRGPLPATVTFFDVGQEVRENAAVESMEFPRLAIGVGQRVSLRANLRNFGETPYPDLRVYFKVDGKEKAVSQANLPAGQHAQVLFTHAFETTGSHVVEVSTEADPLKADNSFLASVSVRDKLPVLLVNGDPNAEPLKGETDFAEIALQPYGAARTPMADLLTTQVIAPAGLKSEALAKASLVVLANVPRLEDAALHALEDFVRQGGGLLIAPGNRVEAAWYQRALARDGVGLLPAALGELAGAAQAASPGVSIAAERFEHPALEIFNDPRNGTLAEASIKSWYKLKPGAGALTLARLDSGDPFLVEKPYGEGRVILMATALDADWSNLPLRSFYLPLLQRLSVYLASTVYPPRNLETGHPLTALLPPAEAGRKAVLTLPTGVTQTLPVVKKGTRGVVEFAQTQQPGLYTLLPPTGPPEQYVVNASRQESDLRRLTAEEIKAFAQTHGVTVVRNAAEYQAMEHQRRYGQEMWKPLLWFLLVGCFGELVLQRRLAGVRKRRA